VRAGDTGYSYLGIHFNTGLPLLAGDRGRSTAVFKIFCSHSMFYCHRLLGPMRCFVQTNSISNMLLITFGCQCRLNLNSIVQKVLWPKPLVATVLLKVVWPLWHSHSGHSRGAAHDYAMKTVPTQLLSRTVVCVGGLVQQLR